MLRNILDIWHVAEAKHTAIEAGLSQFIAALNYLPKGDAVMFHRSSMTQRILRFPKWLLALAVFSLAVSLASAWAGITPTGDVSPSNPSTWTNLAEGYIGNTASGTLTVNGGSDLLSRDAYIGYGNTATGGVNVDGSGSTWNMGYELDVGVHGSGMLSITGGGSVSNTTGVIGTSFGSTGLATVSGSGSKWINGSNFYVGCSGSGTLSITSGGSVSSFWSQIGKDYGSTGAATVDGAGSSWTSSANIYIGDSGSGTLSITNGGTAACSFYSYIGNSSSGSGLVTVSGAGSTWTNSATLYVGNSGSGTLSIANGGTVASNYGFSSIVGYNSGSTGIVSVDGAGSKWINSNDVYIGNGGSGRLSITRGGSVSSGGGGWTNIGESVGSKGIVSVDGDGSTLTNDGFLNVGVSGSGTFSIISGGVVDSTFVYIGENSGSFGAVTLDGAGSRLTTGNYLFVGRSGSGTLSITNGGSVSPGGYLCEIGQNSGSKGVVTVDGNGSILTYGGSFFWIGDSGDGTLSIANGGTVSTKSGTLGYEAGSSGSVAVSGANSKWNASSGLLVGRYGNGTISIRSGGAISGGGSSIGYYSGSRGVAIVDGAGSKWTNSGSLSVGSSGTATLSITGGGSVTATSVSVGSTSLLAIDVGHSSSLKVNYGTGTISNSGTLRLLAAADIAAGTYTPISSGAWSSSGKYQAIGGTLNTSTHVFTASSVTAGVSGVAVPLNLALVQRALISDIGTDKTGWTVGASFLAATTEKDITFTATAISDTIFQALTTAVGNDQTVLSGWTFSTTNYTVSESNPVYLSFDVGAGQSLDTLDLWTYNGSAWSAYAPMDLTYNGTYVSFTGNSLGGFAVSGIPVPEPGTFVLLAVGVVSLFGLVWRRLRLA